MDNKFLIVESNKGFLDFYRMFAERLNKEKGYRFEIKGSSEEALKILEEEHKKFSLVISDIKMIESNNGMELLKYCNENYPHLKFIMVGTALPEDEKILDNMGIPYIGKLGGFHKNKLVNKIEEILQRGMNKKGEQTLVEMCSVCKRATSPILENVLLTHGILSTQCYLNFYGDYINKGDVPSLNEMNFTRETCAGLYGPYN